MSYWNKWYQRTADEKMGAVIAHNFLGGNLITLRYENPDLCNGSVCNPKLESMA